MNDMMQKIYRGLPWLSIGQATDWLRIITRAPVTEDIIISYCAARLLDVSINVGFGRSGTDESDWSCDVVASGYHRMESPEIFAMPRDLRGTTIDLFGHVTGKLPDGSLSCRQIRWFTAASIEDYSLAFQSPHIEALGEKINADELAATASDIEAFKIAAESHRAEKERATLELHEAIREIGELRDEIAALKEKPVATQSLKKSAYLVIAGVIDYTVNTRRTSHTQETIVASIAAKEWPGAGESTIKHLIADAKKTAKESDKEVRSLIAPGA